jgi:PAS domain S-box-containing protein
MYAALVAVFLMMVFSGNAQFSEKQTDTAIGEITFRDVPGITQSEINAIENLQKNYSSFVYGVNPTTEAFTGQSGEIEGYAAMFCAWLSGLFGIEFKPVYYNWGELLNGLESGKVDFTGELMYTAEDKPGYFISDPTINRTIKYYRLEGSVPLDEIIKERRPRYVFLREAVVAADVDANTPYTIEPIIVDSRIEAHRLMETGEADAFFGLDTAEGAFDAYGFNDIVGETFFPMIFRSSCLTTRKEELQPVISVLNKVINPAVLEYLTGLQKTGQQQFMENKLYTQLTEEERAYIEAHPVIPVGAEFSNYPITFYDTHINQWQGIFFEAMDEISKLTGLQFEVVNSPDTNLLEITGKVEAGEILMMAELHQTKEYEGRFIWSDIPILTDNYVFISRADFRNINVNDVFHLKVGLRKHTLYCELFKTEFPSHRNYVEYDTQELTWDALRAGEYDVLFAGRRRLLIYTNYYEEAGFKLNLVFDHTYDSHFAYNRDAALLKSIIDKAMRAIDVDNMVNQWIYKTFDYRQKMADAQRPWLIGAVVLSFLVLSLVTFLFIRSRSAGKLLENMVKQRTDALALETSKLKAIITSIPDLMFCKDRNFRYTQCNTAYEQFMGITEPAILNLTDKDGVWFLPEDMERIRRAEQIVINENRVLVLEENVSSPVTGKMAVFETVKAPIRQNGDVIGLVAIIRDITRRKEMEEEVQAASRAKSAFLANMSHELRTPLNVVIGLTDLIMEDESLGEHTVENLLKISSAGTTLLSLVNDILDFSKIESGKLELVPVEYYVSSLLNDVITMIVTRLAEKPIMFHLDMDNDLPARLFGDDLRVKQVLTNLLTNSVKYTREGDITLSVHCTREGDTVWMDIAVSDTGIGIREEDVQKLFSDYNQVDTKANRKIEGTGLGLSITKRLVEMMGGKILVKSEYGKGSTFSLRLQQRFVDDTPIGADIANKLRHFHYAEDKHIVTKKLVRLNLSYAKVLVVDDMQTNLDVASGLLRKYKMQVDCVDNGAKAIEMIRGEDPIYNAVFMDHMMPGMDGIEAAEKIRAIDTEYARKIPIIALTANAIQGTEQIFYEHGFQAFISKPIDVVEMDSIIRKWVRNEHHEKLMSSAAPSASAVLPKEEEKEKKENMVIEIPGVDTKKGLSLYAGDTDIYLSLLRSYIANTPGVLEKLRSVTAETLSDYVISVHGLKGTSAGIGAEGIRAAALELEARSRAGDLDFVLAHNGDLIADAYVSVDNIKAWIQNYDSHNAKPRLQAPDRQLLAKLRQSCETYDMAGIDKAMEELEKTDYEEDADLVAWLKERLEVSDMDEITQRLVDYER